MPFGNDVVDIYLFGFGADRRLVNPETDVLTGSGREIANHVLQQGVERILSPRAQFNAEFIGLEDLKKGEYVYQPSGDKNLSVYRGLPTAIADATAIGAHEAFYVSSGDCPTLILYHPNLPQVLCAHAGRECLWDKNRVEKNMAPRKFPSVVDTLISQIPKEMIAGVKAFITCGIKTKHFEHHGLSHEKMLTHFAVQDFILECVENDNGRGAISLVSVIIAQLTNHGVPMDQIGYDSIDTYADTHQNGLPKWWSHRRWVTQGRHGTDGRNGVLVIRK